MLIQPGDAAISDTEWRNWLAGHDFGQLAVNDPGNGAPHVVPTHFAVAGGTLLVHLARQSQAPPRNRRMETAPLMRHGSAGCRQGSLVGCL